MHSKWFCNHFLAGPRPDVIDPRVNNPSYGNRNEPRDVPPMRRPELDDRRDMRQPDVAAMNKRPPHEQPGPRGPNHGPPNRGGPGGPARGMDMGGPRPMDPRFGEERYRDNRGPPESLGGPRNFRSPVYDSGEDARGFEPGYRGNNMRNEPGMRRHLGPQQPGPESMDTDLRSRAAPPSNFPQNAGPPRQNQVR